MRRTRPERRSSEAAVPRKREHNVGTTVSAMTNEQSNENETT